MYNFFDFYSWEFEIQKKTNFECNFFRKNGKKLLAVFDMCEAQNFLH